MGFAATLTAGLLLTSALRGRSFGEILEGITSPQSEPEPAAASSGGGGTGGKGGSLTGGGYETGGGKGGAAAQRTFVDQLAKLSGLALHVVEAWALHEQPEGSSAHGGNDWLNIEAGPRGGSGPDSPEALYVEGLSPSGAAKYTYAWLQKNQPGILAAAGKSEAEQVAAIEGSGWAASHYGYAPPSSFLSSRFR
jgi:hypothetical protein